MRLVTAVLLLLCALPLFATSLALSPAPPVTNTPVLATFTTDAIADCGPTDGTVTISGTTIHVALFRAPNVGVCPPDVRPRSATVNLGLLAAGTYTLIAEYKDISWNERFTVADASSIVKTIYFDPPNPDSRTAVTAHVVSSWDACGPKGASALRNGNIISITLNFDCPNQQPAVHFDEAVNLGILPPGTYDVVASPNQLLIAIGSAKLVVQDATSQVSVSPNVVDGGFTRVTLRAPGIAPVCAVAPCPPPQVFFGAAEARVVSTPDTDTIVVEAPALPAGAYDVTVTGFGRSLRNSAGIYYRDQSQRMSIAAEFEEPVLVPVAISGPGAFGAQWVTELTMINGNDFPISAGLFNDVCQPICDARVQPHQIRLVRPNVPDGQLFYISRQAAPRVFFGGLVRDITRSAINLGTELPIVRESDFFDRPFTILNAPGDPGYRVALRLYRIDGGTSLHLRISTLDAKEGYGPAAESAPLVDTDVELTAHDLFASAFIGDLLTRYPQLRDRGPLRIEISGASGQRSSWGFLSITNNATQQVTILTPQ
jgi:hypothetical protein